MPNANFRRVTTTNPTPPAAPAGAPKSGLDRYFHLTARGSTYGREVRGGLATFFTMAYIVVLNPLIIGTAVDINGNFIGGTTDIVKAITMVTAVTALAAGVLSIAMGVFGRFPVAIAAGLGLNGFVAFSLAPNMTWADAMGLVVIEGLVILILVITGLRTRIFKTVPTSLKLAIGAGIGLFLVIIGLVDSGIVRPGVPLVTFGINGTLQGWPILTFCLGLLLTIVLLTLRVKGAILISIIVMTVFAVIVESIAKVGPKISADGTVNPFGWGLNVPTLPSKVFAVPDLGLVWQFNLLGSWQVIGVIATVTSVFSLVLSDFFDMMGTVQGLASEAEIEDKDGNIPHVTSILVVDALAAVGGGAVSASSNTAFIESGAGIAEGARTGIAAIVAGVLFIVAMFITPLVTTVPYEAAAPALIVVGFLMFTQLRKIDFKDYVIGIPAFLTIVVMPFTYSITNGIGVGFITYALLMTVTGKAKKVGWLMWIIAALFLVFFLQTPIQHWLGVGA